LKKGLKAYGLLCAICFLIIVLVGMISWFTGITSQATFSQSPTTSTQPSSESPSGPQITKDLALSEQIPENTIDSQPDLSVFNIGYKIYTIDPFKNVISFIKSDQNMRTFNTNIQISQDGKYVYYRLERDRNQSNVLQKLKIEGGTVSEIKLPTCSDYSFCLDWTKSDRIFYNNQYTLSEIQICNFDHDDFKITVYPKTSCQSNDFPVLLKQSRDGKRIFYECAKGDAIRQKGVFMKYLDGSQDDVWLFDYSNVLFARIHISTDEKYAIIHRLDNKNEFKIIDFSIENPSERREKVVDLSAELERIEHIFYSNDGENVYVIGVQRDQGDRSPSSIWCLTKINLQRLKDSEENFIISNDQITLPPN